MLSKWWIYTLLSFLFPIFGLPLPLWAASLSLEEGSLEEKNLQNQDIHGFNDLVFKNYYITPRGLLETNKGLTIQVTNALILDVYHDKNPGSIINDVSLMGGIWNDICTGVSNSFTGGWVELDWFFQINVSFLNDWKFTAQFIQFVSPPDAFRPENNTEFTLYYNDSKWGLPVVFNPYVRVWWEISGDSNIVVGKRGNTGYVELGMIPTLDLSKYNCPVPLIFSSPTYISAGPPSYWNGGKGALKKEKSHWGLVSTGLKLKIPLNFVPKRLGNWYFDCGGQYFYLINDNLLQAQTFTIPFSSIKHAQRNLLVGYGGIGFEF